MGYPFDRRPYNNPESAQPTEVRNIEEYVKFISNAATVKITIIHEPNVVKRGIQKDNGMGTVNENGEVLQAPKCSVKTSQPSGNGAINFASTPPKSAPTKEGREKKILFIPPNRGPPNRFNDLNVEQNKQWQGPSSFYGFNRGGREADVMEEGDREGDWDYVQDNF